MCPVAHFPPGRLIASLSHGAGTATTHGFMLQPVSVCKSPIAFDRDMDHEGKEIIESSLIAILILTLTCSTTSSAPSLAPTRNER